ncbi:MAG: TetR/AcrR family transcriptional regulator [Burkholderiaceae bacterium]|jgi:AcrR family transcriptional regulator
MSTAERSRQILDGAIQFFAVHGFNGQLRDLARSIGITHALLYHYYPTKQALVDSVYQEVFVERWNPLWDELLDDPKLSVEDKFTRFYADYINNALSRDFVRILVFSGLTDRTITDRFFAMLRERLFPRLIRETRRYRGSRMGGKASEREMELLMGLHGSFFYVTMQRWVYGQTIYNPEAPPPPLSYGTDLVRDRVRSYLLSSAALFSPGEASPDSSRRLPKGRSSSRRFKETS